MNGINSLLDSRFTNTHSFNQSRFQDFWLMGGASIAIWVAMIFAQLFRSNFGSIDQRFQQLGTTFAILSLVCNYPHFMASYSIAYGKGVRFLFQNWFALFLIPILLLTCFLLAFVFADYSFFNNETIVPLNTFFEQIGVSFRIGQARNFSEEMIGLSVWTMYGTAIWHYSKQIFGCMMVYAKYDAYFLHPFQRRILKLSLFSIGLCGFNRLAFHWQDYSQESTKFQYQGISITEIGLPNAVEFFSQFSLTVSLFIFLVFVVFWKAIKENSYPSMNFLIPIIAFFIWWVPIYPQKEFFIILVPFFHSLQYLAFAWRIENGRIATNATRAFRLTTKVVSLVFIGFLCFELIPEFLNFSINRIAETPILNKYSLSILSNPGNFFTIFAAVFINIHHFFLDSVIWKFNDNEVRETLFAKNDPRNLT